MGVYAFFVCSFFVDVSKKIRLWFQEQVYPFKLHKRPSHRVKVDAAFIFWPTTQLRKSFGFALKTSQTTFFLYNQDPLQCCFCKHAKRRVAKTAQHNG